MMTMPINSQEMSYFPIVRLGSLLPKFIFGIPFGYQPRVHFEEIALKLCGLYSFNFLSLPQ